jgi:hypothetical protein
MRMRIRKMNLRLSPGVPVSNIFEVPSGGKQNQPEDDENLTSVNYGVRTSSLDPQCNLETISNLNPSNNSRATTTSKNLNIFTDEDHLSPSEEKELMNLLKNFSVKVDAMTLKLHDTAEELKRR